jgi:hypothetical protein
VNTTEKRLAKLETELNRTRQFALVALIIAAMLLLGAVISAKGGADVITAEKFILVDDAGRVRGELTTGEYGPGLALYDENGIRRAIFGPGLALCNENGFPQAILHVTGDKREIGLSDANCRIRVSLSTYDDGTSLYLHDENGKSGVGLVVGETGTGLEVYDENGGTRIVLAVGERGPGLYLYDEEGNRIWSAP